jgi:general secretion pathway protein D
MNKNKMFLIGMSTKACVAILASLIATVSLAQSAERPSLLRNRASSSLLSNRSANLSRPAAEPVATTDSNSKAKSKQVEPGGRSIEFNQAPVEMVFKVYGELKGVTVLKDPQAPSATITLQPLQGQELTDEEKILAIETILEMNGIHLEPYGEKFCRALPRKDVRRDGLPIVMDPDAELQESTRVVSVMVPFKNISIEEAQKALEGFKSSSGLLLVFERTNSILITDTQSNINRMREIARMIDVTSPVTENVFVRQIRNAVAADIKTALEAIVQKSKEELEKNGKQPSAVAQTHTASPFGLRRNLLQRNNTTPQPAANQASIVTSVSDADRGMIRGKVLILSDERSNKLIIVTSKSNMDFFDKVIEQLDVETVPPTVVKVYRLKYADAEDVSDMINDLIGNAPSGKSGSKSGQNAAAKTSGASGANMTTGRTAQPRQSTNKRTGEPQAGELSKENTTILADKRINGLVVMTQKELVPTVESIIEAMDVKLSQVLIETVIIEVTLSDDLNTGIDWVQRGRELDKDGNLVRDNFFNNGHYMLGGGGGTTTDLLTGLASKSANASPIGAGVNYLMKSDRLNLAAVIKASKTDSRAKYIASPIIMTVDNKEATIDATENRQFVTGWTAQSGSYGNSGLPTPNYSAKDIGIKIKVTPKINPNGTVMLTVEEEYSRYVPNGQAMLIPGNSSSTNGSSSYVSGSVDLAVERKMSADVRLENMQTVVFGGLTETSVSDSETGIPILKDIPWIGKWLFSSVKQTENRKELLVFMTPYVLDDAESTQLEAFRRKKALSDPSPWEDNGWSASELADPVSQKEIMRRLTDEWKKQDAERKSKLAIEQAKIERVKQLKALSEEERKVWLKMHKEELEKEAREELEEKMLDEKSQEELKKITENARKRKLEESERNASMKKDAQQPVKNENNPK